MEKVADPQSGQAWQYVQGPLGDNRVFLPIYTKMVLNGINVPLPC